MTSNVGQNYPYSSESEGDRAARIAELTKAREGLDAKLAAETTPLDERERWWTWKCPTPKCPGILHVGGGGAPRAPSGRTGGGATGATGRGKKRGRPPPYHRWWRSWQPTQRRPRCLPETLCAVCWAAPRRR